MLSRYIPIDFTSTDNGEFIKYQQLAVYVNTENNLHNYAFLAWHLLWMSFLQKIALFIFKNDEQWIIENFTTPEAIRTFRNAQTPYCLSTINEKTLCKITGNPNINLHPVEIDDLRHLVESRDHTAHCTGVINHTSKVIESNVEQSLKYAKKIQDKISPMVFEKQWVPFIDNIEKGEGFSLVYDSVTEFFRINYLSIADLEYIAKNHKIKIGEFYNNVCLLPIINLLSSATCTEIDSDELDSLEKHIIGMEYSTEDKQKLADELTALNMA